MHTDRLSSLDIGPVKLALPVFFPSISSVKTNLAPVDYVRILNSLSSLNAQFLVSAFDLQNAGMSREAMQIELALARNKGTVILMDSGNYESYWKDAMAVWLPNNFYDALSEFPCCMAFGFDEQQPPVDPSMHIRLLVDRYEKDQATANLTSVIPIVHGDPDQLPYLLSELARISGIKMVATPERRLGDGLFNRAKTVQKIRRSLNDLDNYVALHLLGTGNPLSIAVYSIAGADSFDGLEWCQTVVDHNTGLLFHFTQADLFKVQTGWGGEDLPFTVRVLAHNLEFYSSWMMCLREAIKEAKGISFCRLSFPKYVFDSCSTALNWGSRYD